MTADHDPGDAGTATTRRPFGVYVIIAVLMVIIASNWFDVLRVGLRLTPLALPDLGNPALINGLNAVITIVLGVVIVGLFTLRRWAWIATMILLGIALAFGIGSYFTGGRPFVILFVGTIAVFYLNQGEVQRSFGQQASTGTVDTIARELDTAVAPEDAEPGGERETAAGTGRNGDADPSPDGHRVG